MIIVAVVMEREELVISMGINLLCYRPLDMDIDEPWYTVRK
jgi:hypothetical protein